MKLRISLDKLLAYSSKNWQIKTEKVNLPSVTQTSIPRIGYGGYGWLLTVASTIKVSKIIVYLYKNAERIGTYTLNNVGECVLYPNGGVTSDYSVVIKNK